MTDNISKLPDSENNYTVNRLIKFIFIILTLIMIFSLGFTPMRTDNDVWWHLKTGKYIVENNYKLPKYDVFTYTAENIEWHNHEWLSQVIFYWVYQIGEGREIGGVRMLIIFKSILLVLTGIILYILASMRTRNFSAAIFATIFAALLLKRTIYVRPPIFTYFLLSFFLLVLYNVNEKRWKLRYLIPLPIIMIIWANLHGGFLTGLIAIGSFWTESLLKLIYKKYFKKESDEHNLFLPLSLVLFVSFLGSLCTPYGINLYLLTGRVMNDTGLVRSIPELHSPDFFFTWAFEILIIFMIIGYGIIKKQIFTIAEVMLFVFFFHQAIQHVRHISLIGVVSAGMISLLANELMNEINSNLKKKKLLSYSLLLISLLLIPYSMFHRREGDSFFDRNMKLLKGLELEKESYPVELANFILSNPFHGKMYNQINYAGYLIWRMSPEKHKVFTDSRFDIFGSKFVWDMMDIENAVDYSTEDRNFENLLDKYEINFVVVTRGVRLNQKLEDNPNWQLVYFWIPPSSHTTDNGYSIFVRNTEENKELIDSCLKIFKTIALSKKRLYPINLLAKLYGEGFIENLMKEN